MTITTFDSAGGQPEPMTMQGSTVAGRQCIDPYNDPTRGELHDTFMQWLQAKRDDLTKTRPDYADPVDEDNDPRQATKYERQRYATRSGVVMLKAGQSRPEPPPVQWYETTYKAGLWAVI